MQLELYQMEGCPYCATVREALDELGASYVTHYPRSNEERMAELLELGGEDQVPFLVVRDDDGAVKTTMYESDEIVAWLRSEVGE